MSSRGPILDPPLEGAWLDPALRIARGCAGASDARALLALALGDATLGNTAKVKRVPPLTRIWVEPPPAAQDAIEWAKSRLVDEPDQRVLHVGAVLATYPFFGDCCAAV